VRSDYQGRFEIATGGGTVLAISHERLDAWQAAVPASGELAIRLPEPARVEIEANIDGAGKEVGVCYQLVPHLMPGFASMQSERAANVANPGKLVFDALPPGTSQFWRGSIRMLEREIFELKAGEKKTIQYLRGKGARVRGKMTWPADAKLSSIVVAVLSQEGSVYSSQHPAEDGSFLTERIPAGTQHLEAYAFKVLGPEEMMRSGPIPPSYLAQVTIEVPAEGELTVKDLELKPIGTPK
jgi:hypothetical protein